MGDLVLTADEVSPVMQKLAEEGIEITALHNPLLRTAPATLYTRRRRGRKGQFSRSARRLGLEQDAPDGAERRGASAD